MSTVSIPSQLSKKLVATCPACQTRFKIKPYMSGRKAKCGRCQTRMRIPTLRAKINEAASSARRRIASVLPGPSTQSTQRVQQSAQAVPGVRTAGVGLLLNAWGIVIMMSVATAALTMNIVAAEQLLQIKYYLGGGFAAGALMSLIGLLTCSFVPQQSRARGWAISSITFCILNMAVIGYAAYCFFENLSMVVPQLAVNLTASGLGALAFFCFLFFVKNTAKYANRPELSATARGIMWFQLMILSVVTGMFALGQTMPASDSMATLIQCLGIGSAIAALANTIILVVLQFQLGSNLRRR